MEARLTSSLRRRHRLAALVLTWFALLTVAPPTAAITDDLPDMGSPSDAILSKEEEARYGRAIYRNLYATGTIVTTPEIQEYIQNIGLRLAANAQDGEHQFRFFVVNDPAINAFALPGGYIGIHTGLILASETESELAGVMAHEIAHVTQRHISRAVYANQRVSMISMAALLGAILVGVAGGASGDAVQGAVVASQGIAAQEQINFTRSNEYEADRVGIKVLHESGFDPDGMGDFFETMGRKTGSAYSAVPEFLRTHPVTTNRIAEARSRASQYPSVEYSDSFGYDLTRAHIRLLSARSPEEALRAFNKEREELTPAERLGSDYGAGLALLELSRYDEAAAIFSQLMDDHEGIIQFHSGLGLAELGRGNDARATAIFEQAIALFPRNMPLTLHYAETLMTQGKAREAHELLLDLLNNTPPTPQQVRQIALAASAAGDTADAHTYMAEYHLMNGNLPMAADQLRLALGIPGLDNVQRARIRARLDQVNDWMIQSQRAARR